MKKFIISHLYPKELNLYGDDGNIAFLKYLLNLYDYSVEVVNISVNADIPKDTSFIFSGGGPDSLQNTIYSDFLRRKDFIKDYITSGKPSLYICGSYQLLGKYYLTSDNVKIPGLGVFDFYTESPKSQSKRIVGNSVSVLSSSVNYPFSFPNTLVGFQNHNGRTYYDVSKMFPIAYDKNVKMGNNDIDFTEGLLFKKTACSYLHGPILVKNPHLAFYLLSEYLNKKVDYRSFYSMYISHVNMANRIKK